MNTAQKIEVANKWCPKCETVKPVGDFGSNRRHKDGKQAVCRACLSAYQREYWQQKKKKKARAEAKALKKIQPVLIQPIGDLKTVLVDLLLEHLEPVVESALNTVYTENQKQYQTVLAENAELQRRVEEAEAKLNRLKACL